MYPLWEDLKRLKGYRWVELSHSMNNDSPYWAGIPEGSVELGKVLFDWGNPMLECQIQGFQFPGGHGLQGLPQGLGLGQKSGQRLPGQAVGVHVHLFGW